MERRSLFSFDLMSQRSKGTREIEIPLLKKKTSSKEIREKYRQQIASVDDACNTPKRAKPTAYEKLCGWLQRNVGVVNPESNFFLMWNIVNLIAIFYNFLQIPIVILVASADQQDYYTWRIFTHIDIGCLAVLFLDLIFVRFRVAIDQKERLITDSGVILTQYLQLGVVIDLAALIVYSIEFVVHGDAIYVKLLFYLKYYTFRQIDEQVGNRLMYNQYSNALYRFLRMVSFIFFLTSLQACIYFSIDYFYYTQQGTNYQLGYLWLTSSQATLGLNLIEAFNWPAWYDFALYWAVQTTSAVGYGNMTPRNPAEVLLCNIVMLTTVCIFVAFADTILDIVDQLQENTLRRQAKFTEINTFTAANSVQSETRKKVVFFFDCLIESKYDDSEDFLCSIVSQNLQQEFTLSFRSFIFNNIRALDLITKDQHSQWNLFARQLSNIVKVVYFSTGDYVQRMGKTSDFKLYIIQRGKVTVFNDTVDYKKDHRVLESFGQKQFFFGGISLSNVVCRTFNKFYFFERKEFFAILKDHRSQYQKLLEMVDDVRFNRKLTGDFHITCHNCDEFHLIECCPIATMWRNSLPKLQKSIQTSPHQRVSFHRSSVQSHKQRGLLRQGLSVQQVSITKSYFPYMNL